MTAEAAMTPDDRLREVAEACRVIVGYMSDATLPEDVLSDAVRMRLVEIGEAVKRLPRAVTDAEPDIPWNRIGALGHQLVRRQLEGARPIVLATARTDVPKLLDAAERLLLTHS